MKIDKNALDKVLSLNDEQLWKAIQLVAAKSGISSTKNLEKPADMSKIRATLTGLNEIDTSKITELFEKGKSNGREQL